MTDSIPSAEKRCTHCQTVKPLSAFNKHVDSKDGREACCMSCRWREGYLKKNPPTPGYKKCSSCQELVPLEEFYAEKRSRDGHGYECKPCQKERMNRLVSASELSARERASTREKRPKEHLQAGYKRCLKCDEVKPVEEFYKRPINKDGLYSYCKTCHVSSPRISPLAIPETKQCTLCGEVKSADGFYMSRTGKKGLRSECKECSKQQAALVPYSRIKNRRVHLQRYGLTIEAYEEMFRAQNGCCAVCKQPETLAIQGKIVSLAVDHCRATGAVRGLLCKGCNQALGLLYEDPDIIESLLQYVHERVLW